MTHQTAGDTFWDLVRRGRRTEAAAAKDNIEPGAGTTVSYRIRPASEDTGWLEDG